MDRQHLLPVGEGEVDDGRDDLDARIRHEYVDATEFGGDRLDAGVDLRLVGDVHRHAHRTITARIELTRGGLRRLDVEVGDCNLGAGCEEDLGDVLADAARRAGNDGNLVVEVH